MELHENISPPVTPARMRLRRVVIEDPVDEQVRERIEERQRRTVEQVRLSHGYSGDVDPRAHSHATFKLINQRKQLDERPGSEFVLPLLDDWKFWTKMNDWDSRNRLLEELTGKLRRREASTEEIELLVVVCGGAWRKVARSLRRYGGVDLDPGADGRHQREEARRVNELDRDELDQVVQHALLDALIACPRPFPRRFFAWLEETLAHRALDHVRSDLTEHCSRLPDDDGIRVVLDQVLTDTGRREAGFYAQPASPGHAQWLRTLDLAAIFSVAEEYAPYARARSATERAVDRLPTRQRQVVQDHYFNAMKQAQIAAVQGVAASTIRNTHQGALRNLRGDDQLFDVLEAVGKVRDRARRLAIEHARGRAA